MMRAGEIARRVRARVPELAVAGARMVDVAERIEELISFFTARTRGEIISMKFG